MFRAVLINSKTVSDADFLVALNNFLDTSPTGVYKAVYLTLLATALQLLTLALARSRPILNCVRWYAGQSQGGKHHVHTSRTCQSHPD